MISRVAGGVFGLCMCTASVSAQDLRLPGNAVETSRSAVAVDSHAIATGPWATGNVPSDTVEGTVTTTTWRIPVQGITTLQMLRPLRDQLGQAGFVPVFSCETNECGGFDFRFAIPVMNPPEMQVDLGDFRYFSASKDGLEGRSAVSVLLSSTARAGYVQLIQVGPPEQAAPAATSDGATLRAASSDDPAPAGSVAEALEGIGRTVLGDLAFETGSATLAAGSYASLQDLADFLADNPDLTVALVGHTDAEGSLDGNIALSKRRAGSVLERLVSDYGVARRQLEAQGMGYLSPIANNRTEDGRNANRRVEVIMTSTQ